MSKADEKSKQYREYREKCGIKDPVMLNEIEEAYFQGYHQAEKDLALRWVDINKIERLIKEVYEEYPHGIEVKEFGMKVLNRFNKQKEK